MRRSDAVMVSSGDDQEMVLPLWLRSITSAKLYYSCETHPSELRSFYCRDWGSCLQGVQEGTRSLQSRDDKAREREKAHPGKMWRSDAVMVSSGDDQEMVAPRWLRSITSAKLYHPCDTHPSELRTFYCRVCGVALCKECKGRRDLCNHEVIKAFKASKGPSFRWDDLEPLWDISGICPYSQNGYLVAYINKRGAGIARSRSQSGSGECKSCQFGFKTEADYCSVECKVEAVMKMEGSGTQTTTVGSDGDVQSYRKRPRKQKNPPRAPFY